MAVAAKYRDELFCNCNFSFAKQTINGKDYIVINNAGVPVEPATTLEFSDSVFSGIVSSIKSQYIDIDELLKANK